MLKNNKLPTPVDEGLKQNQKLFVGVSNNNEFAVEIGLIYGIPENQLLDNRTSINTNNKHYGPSFSSKRIIECFKPIEEISDYAFKQYSEGIKLKDCSNIFEYGVYMASCVNKKLKQLCEDRVSIAGFICSSDVIYSIVEEKTNKICTNFIVFGLTNQDHYNLVINMLEKMVHINRIDTYTDDGIIININGYVDVNTLPELFKTVSDIRDLYGSFYSEKNSILKNINFLMDGNKEFYGIKSQLIKLSKYIENIKKEQYKIQQLKDCFVELHRIDKILKLDSAYNAKMMEFNISGGLISPIKPNFNESRNFISNGLDIEEVNIPSINELKLQIGKNGNDPENDVLCHFLKFKERTKKSINKELDEKVDDGEIINELKRLSSFTPSDLRTIRSLYIDPNPFMESVLIAKYGKSMMSHTGNKKFGLSYAWLIEYGRSVDDIGFLESANAEFHNKTNKPYSIVDDHNTVKIDNVNYSNVTRTLYQHFPYENPSIPTLI